MFSGDLEGAGTFNPTTSRSPTLLRLTLFSKLQFCTLGMGFPITQVASQIHKLQNRVWSFWPKRVVWCFLLSPHTWNYAFPQLLIILWDKPFEMKDFHWSNDQALFSHFISTIWNINKIQLLSQLTIWNYLNAYNLISLKMKIEKTFRIYGNIVTNLNLWSWYWTGIILLRRIHKSLIFQLTWLCW